MNNKEILKAIQSTHISVPQENKNKFVELGEEGEIKFVQHNVRFYRCFWNEIKKCGD